MQARPAGARCRTASVRRPAGLGSRERSAIRATASLSTCIHLVNRVGTALGRIRHSRRREAGLVAPGRDRRGAAESPAARASSPNSSAPARAVCRRLSVAVDDILVTGDRSGPSRPGVRSARMTRLRPRTTPAFRVMGSDIQVGVGGKVFLLFPSGSSPPETMRQGARAPRFRSIVEVEFDAASRDHRIQRMTQQPWAVWSTPHPIV